MNVENQNFRLENCFQHVALSYIGYFPPSLPLNAMSQSENPRSTTEGQVINKGWLIANSGTRFGMLSSFYINYEDLNILAFTTTTVLMSSRKRIFLNPI